MLVAAIEAVVGWVLPMALCAALAAAASLWVLLELAVAGAVEEAQIAQIARDYAAIHENVAAAEGSNREREATAGPAGDRPATWSASSTTDDPDSSDDEARGFKRRAC